MNIMIVFFGIMPLIAFVVLDFYSGMRTGIIAAIIFALFELIFTLMYFKSIDIITIISILTVLLLGFVAWKKNSVLIFKLQPVLLGSMFSLAFLIMHFIDNPLLVFMIKKYKNILPIENQKLLLSNENILVLSNLSHILGWGFLVHTFTVTYAAFYMSNLWWLLIRGIGIYVMMFICMLISRLF